MRLAPTLTSLLLLGAFTTGCATSYDVRPPVGHILAFDASGQPIALTKGDPGTTSGAPDSEIRATDPNPTQGEEVPLLYGQTEELDASRFEQDIEEVLRGMHDFERRCSAAVPCELSFFVHGGLKTHRASINRALESLCGNLGDKAPCDLHGPMFEGGRRYPLFVTWNSSLLSSYLSHLLRIQRGRDLRKVGWIGAPWKLTADVGKAISRSPIVVYEMLSHDLRTVPGQRLRRAVEKDAHLYYLAMERAAADAPDDNVRVQQCVSQTSVGERLRSLSTYVPTLAPKILLSPFLDAFGTVSWDVMSRRVDLLFEDEVFCAKTETCDHELVPESPLRRVRTGGLGRFLVHLEDAMDRRRLDPSRWTVTLIGHSMGGIVVNRIVRGHPALPVERVVYMASAATVRDTEETTTWLLGRRPNARVYHLVLHPTAELRERNFFDLSPRGSLLVWIDNFLSKPNTLEDRTAGRFTNISRSLAALPADLKARVQLTVFGVGKGVPSWMPTKHGQFVRPSVASFWDESFWSPDFDATPGCSPTSSTEDEVSPLSVPVNVQVN